MNHEDENELFQRLESEMAEEQSGRVLDFGKARSARAASAEADSASANDPDEAASEPDEGPVMVDPPKISGPGLMERIRGARRNALLPGWLRSKPELLGAASWLVGYVGHTAAYHAIRTPYYAANLAVRSPFGRGQGRRGHAAVGVRRRGGAAAAGSRSQRGHRGVSEALPPA